MCLLSFLLFHLNSSLTGLRELPAYISQTCFCSGCKGSSRKCIFLPYGTGEKQPDEVPPKLLVIGHEHRQPILLYGIKRLSQNKIYQNLNVNANAELPGVYVLFCSAMLFDFWAGRNLQMTSGRAGFAESSRLSNLRRVDRALVQDRIHGIPRTGLQRRISRKYK